MLIEGLKQIYADFMDLLLPAACALCHTPVLNNEPICDTCLSELPKMEGSLCARCGIPFTKLCITTQLCATCSLNPPAYDKARFAGPYESGLRTAIRKLKYSGELRMARVLSMILLNTYRCYYADTELSLIIPVPAHPKKMRRRGFNQVILIADGLAHYTNTELDRFSLAKRLDTRAQVGLSAGERLANVHGAYVVRRPQRIYGRRILLVDDVSTTGATLRETASALRAAGAQSVHALAVAHRILQKGTQLENKGNTSATGAVLLNHTQTE